MKTLLAVVSVLLLCSCAGAPMLQTSVNGNSYTSPPTSINDPRMRSAEFYMNDDKSPVEYAAPPSTQLRPVDNFCAANCQASRHTLDYCSRACAF